MNAEVNPDFRMNAGEYLSPWEESLNRNPMPAEAFIHRQTTSGLLLTATAISAFIGLCLASNPAAVSD